MRRAYIVIILILISFGLKAQVYQAMPQAGYGPVKRMLTDSVLTIPTGINSLRNITGGRDAGQIRWNTTDSGFYVYSGYQWIKINIDSVSLSNRINSKLNISDTAAMLAPYMKKVDTISLSNRIDLRVKYSDTALMLDPYLRKLDTASLSNRINKKMDSLVLTTTGNSGASTLIGSTLNVPNYSGALTGYVPYTGATANVNLGLKSLNGAVVTVDSSFQIKNRSNSWGNSLMDYTAITAERDGFNFFTVWMQGAEQYQNGAQFVYPFVSGMVNNTKQYRLPVRNGTIALVEDTVNLSSRIDTKLNYTDTASLSNRINLKADKSTTLTINGTGYDLSANRSWTIPVVDTTSLSNRINTKLNISDTATMLAPYLRKADTTSLSNRINTKLNISDTALMLSNYQSAINARVKYSDTAAMLDPYLTAAVTSVGLSMPVAFNVSNSPVTSTGTIAVTGAGTAAQYIRGDGQLATLPSGASGGSSVDYYLNGGTSQGTIGGSTYYEMSKIPVIGTAADFDRTNAQGDGLIAQFITDSLDPNRTEIPAGAWNFEMFFSSSSSGGSPSYYIELLKYDGTNFTTIASGSANPEGITNGTTIDLYLSSLAVPYTMLNVTDRLAVRVYVTTSGKTITLHTQNGHLCLITTTFAGGVTSLNGLAANTQYLAVDTVGSDFNINSLIDTHTFNLPTASATKRGALKSSDWSTFNGKMNYSDTVSLSNRINTKLNSADTVSLSNRINTKLNSSDTASLSNRINTKLNSSDTASLSNRINTKADILSGTTNTVPKFTSSTTIGNSNIKDNGNAVTVNATAGVYGALQVGSYNGNILMNTSNASAGLIFQNTSASNKLWDFSSFDNDINFSESGIAPPVMTLKSGGNVGINTNVPGHKLEVNGTFKSVGVATFGSTLSNGTYGYTLPSATGTLALTSQLTSGTVTSIATGLGLSGGTITTSGTLLVDTSSASILSRQRAANTYATTSALSGYLPLTGGTLTGALNGTEINASMPSGNGALYVKNSSLSGKNWTFIPSTNGGETDLLLFYTGSGAGTRLTLASTGAATFSSSVTAGNGSDGSGYKMKATDGSVFRLIDASASGVNFGAIGTTTGNVRIHATDVLFLSNGGIEERMRITSTGNVGIGTTAPASKLQVEGATSDLFNLYSSTNAGEFSIKVPSTNLVNFELGTGDDLAIKTSALERMRITSGGNTLIGTGTDNSSGAKLQVNGAATATGITISTGGGTNIANTVNIDTDGGGTARYYSHGSNSSTVGSHAWHNASSNGTIDNTVFTLTSDGIIKTLPTYNNATALAANVQIDANGFLARSTVSSRRFKENINDWNGNGLNTILALKPVTFKYKKEYYNKADIQFLGLIAEDVAEVSPYLADYENEDRTGKVENVRYATIVVPLIKAVQELQLQIETLKAEIEKLKK